MPSWLCASTCAPLVPGDCRVVVGVREIGLCGPGSARHARKFNQKFLLVQRVSLDEGRHLCEKAGSVLGRDREMLLRNGAKTRGGVSFSAKKSYPNALVFVILNMDPTPNPSFLTEPVSFCRAYGGPRIVYDTGRNCHDIVVQESRGYPVMTLADEARHTPFLPQCPRFRNFKTRSYTHALVEFGTCFYTHALVGTHPFGQLGSFREE